MLAASLITLSYSVMVMIGAISGYVFIQGMGARI